VTSDKSEQVFLVTCHLLLVTVFLPARLNDAGNLTLERQLAKTDAAQIKLSQIAARSAAAFAASVSTYREFRLAF